MRASASVAFLAIALALLVAGIALSFWAGCTGDLKGGALGDPTGALRLQGFAAMAALTATASLVGSAATLKTKNTTMKTALAALAVLCTGTVWFTVGWEAETQGVMQCFTKQ
jgi:hypothetical protein